MPKLLADSSSLMHSEFAVRLSVEARPWSRIAARNVQQAVDKPLAIPGGSGVLGCWGRAQLAVNESERKK
ncbi:MAG: hypothetical protein GY889_15825 [Proteobacteria bacterium]|nr:hypothetical protein [Pseudomonadota bacterium]